MYLDFTDKGFLYEQKRIITISRSFGSGGRMIGEELARRLSIISMTAILLDLLSEKTGISEQGWKCGRETAAEDSGSLCSDQSNGL